MVAAKKPTAKRLKRRVLDSLKVVDESGELWADPVTHVVGLLRGWCATVAREPNSEEALLGWMDAHDNLRVAAADMIEATARRALSAANPGGRPKKPDLDAGSVSDRTLRRRKSPKGPET